MTIVLRNPFITKAQKEAGCLYLRCASDLMQTADILRKDGEAEYAEVAYKATIMWNKAAKTLGFMSIKDLDAWIKSGKKL